MTYIKKLSLIFLAAALTVTFVAFTTISAYASESTANPVILSVEAFTVGGDFILQPTEVTTNGTSTLSDLLNDTLGRNEINFGQGAGRELTNFTITRSDSLRIKDEIVSVLQEKAIPSGAMRDHGWLSKGDFTRESHWVIIVNNKASAQAPDIFRPSAGDVIRVSFSVFGDGADLALAKTNMPSESKEEPIFPAANRDELYKEIARHNAESDFELDYYIIGTAANVTSTQAEIDRALNFLNLGGEYEEIYDPSAEGNGYEQIENGNGYSDIDDPYEENGGEPPPSPPPSSSPPGTPSQTVPQTTNPADNIPDSPSSPTGVNIFSVAPLALISGMAGIIAVLSKKKKR